MPPACDRTGAISRDETEQELAAHTVRSLVEAFASPMAVIGLDGKVACVNDHTRQLTGADGDALLGADFTACFTEPLNRRARPIGGYWPTARSPTTRWRCGTPTGG